MTFLLLNAPSPTPISVSLKRSSSSNPRTIPVRDLVIDFGKHKGKMLGTLPSNYLRWVSKNLRARDFEHWANLADHVLQDPVYQDRIEWEFAENVLHGNNAKVTTNSSSFLSSHESAVSMLLEISERFGWDNEDKAGWSKVNFELLGTSKGGRIPRILDNDGERTSWRREEKQVKRSAKKHGDGVLVEKRRERRERARLKREEEKLGNKQMTSLGRVRLERSEGFDKDQTVKIYNNPFPGREALLNKVINSRRF